MSTPDEVMKLKDGKIIVDKLKGMVATQFVEATANDAGSYVVYQGQVYYLPDGHTANVTWANTTKVGPTNIGAQLAQIKTDITKLTPAATSSDIGKALIVKTVADGKPTSYEYGKATADPQDIADAVDDWLDEHPEATTTVEDGSITQAKLNNEMSSRMDIVKAIFNPDHTTILSVGSRNTMTGANADSTTRMRTEYLDKGITVIAPCSGYKFMLFAYMDNGGYVGVWNGSTFVIPDGSWLTTPLNIAALNKYYKYKIIAAKTDNSTIDISTDAQNIKFVWETDTSVSVSGLPADAKETRLLIDSQKSIAKYSECISTVIKEGSYTFTSDDFESGSRSLTTKTDNSKRIRVMYMIPVRANTVILYSNPTLKLYIAVFSSPTQSSGQPLENTGWINAGSNGEIKISHTGYMAIILESGSNITPSSYDCTIKMGCDGYTDINPQYYFRTAEQASIPVGNNALSYANFITNTWEVLRTTYSSVISRTTLINDTSDTYPIYEYVIEPEYPQKTVMIVAGMHGDEYEGFWSLYKIFNYLFTNGYKYEKTRNLLRDTKFIIIPVLNPYGVENKSRENSAGVNAHQNYDVRWSDTSYSRTGTSPFQYNEPKAVKLSLENHNDVDLFIEFHTDPYEPEKGNYTEVIETSQLLQMAYNITLDERQYLKNEYNYSSPLSMNWGVWPTKQCNSIRYLEEVWNIPAILLEVGVGGEAQTGTEKQMNIAFAWYLNCIAEAIKSIS